MSEPTATLHRWAELPLEALNPLLGRRMITTERVMVAQITLEQGCIVPRHSHESEQLAYVLEGRMRFTLGEQGERVVELGPGELLEIPSWLPHEAEALEWTLDLDIFTPPRQDWLEGRDGYLRST